MIGQLILPEIQDLIEKRNFSVIRQSLEELDPIDVADIIADLELNSQAIIFRILKKEFATDVFEYLEVDNQVELLKSLGNEDVVSILNEMSPDDRTALLEEVPASVAKQLISQLSPEEMKIATKLLGYPENSIGRLMTPDYIAINKDMTVLDALNYIRNFGKDSETLNVIYVVDRKGRMIDDIKIRDFLFAPFETKVEELMDENYVTLSVYDDQETAVQLFKKYDRVALPVVDSDGILIGIVTIDDVLDVAEEEATEDIHKMGAVDALEEPYIDVSMMDIVKKRAPWLIILFIGGMFTATAMAHFEEEISKLVILAIFIPLIISSGGNSGSQAATLVIRSLSLGELKIKDWFFVVKRELLTGLILGTILGVLGFFRVFFTEYFSHSFGNYWFPLGLTVSISLVGIVLWGTLVGSLLPLLLKKIGLDPATSSAPFVATLVDITGIVIYFSVAMLFLSHLF